MLEDEGKKEARADRLGPSGKPRSNKSIRLDAEDLSINNPSFSISSAFTYHYNFTKHGVQRVLRDRDPQAEAGQGRPGAETSTITRNGDLSLTTSKVIELLQEVSKYVKDNEPGTLRYEVTRDLRPGKDGNEDIVMIER